MTINIKLYRWGGAWGPFKVTIPCGECSLTEAIIQDVLQNDLPDIPVKLTSKDWLSVWWQPLVRGGWHAPIVIVDNQLISQGVALNRGVLIQSVIKAYTSQFQIKGNHLFGKENCRYCLQAKEYLDAKGIVYHYYDVIREPRALYEMINRVKPLIPKNKPVTMPQIWLNGQYIGGAETLLKTKIK